MASKRYVPGVDGKPGTYLPCPKCLKRVCECLELRLLAQIEGAGLPRPMREFRFAPPRLWKADMAWPRQKIIVEVEGGGAIGRHTDVAGFHEDCVKYNVIAALGYKLVRVDGKMVKNGEAIKFIVAAYQNQVYIPERTTRRRTGERRRQQEHRRRSGAKPSTE